MKFNCFSRNLFSLKFLGTILLDLLKIPNTKGSKFKLCQYYCFYNFAFQGPASAGPTLLRLIPAQWEWRAICAQLGTNPFENYVDQINFKFYL